MIPSQFQPLPIPTTHLLKIHLNAILLSLFQSPKWSFPKRFPHLSSTCTPSLPIPTNHSLLDFTIRTLGDLYKSQRSSLCNTLTAHLIHFLRSKYLLSSLFPHTCNLCPYLMLHMHEHNRINIGNFKQQNVFYPVCK